MSLIPMPEGVECSLTLYLTSDIEGVNIVYTVGGMPAFVDKMLTTVDLALLKERGALPPLADDWRVMTRAEIKDYKDEEASNDSESVVLR